MVPPAARSYITVSDRWHKSKPSSGDIACKVIQVRLGHATITETMDTYGHLFPDAEDLGRGAIDAIFAMAPTEQERNQETW